jgi:hypothetical protein
MVLGKEKSHQWRQYNGHNVAPVSFDGTL